MNSSGAASFSNEEFASAYESLTSSIAALDSALVAFSGGVDSTLLLYAAHEALGERAVAVTARSCLFPSDETEEARSFCAELGIEHVVVDYDPLASADIAENNSDRCYLCKHMLFETFVALADERGLQTVIEGTNADDAADYRPGAKALQELGAVSPLAQAGLTKETIRALSHELGLAAWDKPSLACLASRIPYGEALTQPKLARVEQAEKLLVEAGFRQVRVRSHDDLARIEAAPDELDALLVCMRGGLTDEFHRLGFAYVSMDLDGYKTGSMNRQLDVDQAES